MWNKKTFAALFVVMLLVVSVLTMLANPAEGAAVSDEELTPDDEYGWLSRVDIDGAWANIPNEPDEDIYVGQSDVEMLLYYTENITQAGEEWQITHSEIDTEEIVRFVGDEDEWYSEDDNDWVDGTGNLINWRPDDGQMTSPTDASTDTEEDFDSEFIFDVSYEATPGIYKIPVEVKLRNRTIGEEDWEDEVDSLEYVWLELSANAEVSDFTLDPGMEFENVDVGVENIGEENLEDVYLTLEENDIGNDVTIHNPENKAYVNNIWPGQSEDFTFTFTVPLDEESDFYEVDYTIEATLIEDEDNPIDIVEHGTIIVTINPIVELTAEIEENQVEQGTPISNFTTTFTNTGNLDLERIRVLPLEDDAFSLPSDYYENLDSEKEHPAMNIGDLNVGQSTEVEFTLGLDQYMQIGRHKLNFGYSAFYYDETGEVTGEEGSSYARVGNLHEDWDDDEEWGPLEEDPDPYDLLAETDEPFAWIEVIESDVALDVGVTHIDPVGLAHMGYRPVSVRVNNFGHVDYANANIALHTAGTPFINPEDPNENTIEMMDEPFSLHGNTDRTVTFGVLIDSEFIENRLRDDEPVYSAGFTLEGVHGDTLEEVELSFTGEGFVFGIGPKLMVTGEPADNTVEPGEKFELTYDIENMGDEPIRDIEVKLSPNMTDGNIYSFDSAQDAVYFRQADGAPGSYIWTVEPEDTTLYPGENTTVTFHMVSSGDMEEGAIYHLDIEMSGVSAVAEEGARVTWQSGSTIRTEDSSSTKPIFTTQLSYVLMALIIGAAFVIGVYLFKKEKKTKPEKEETLEEEPTEDEYTFEETESEEIEPDPSEGTDWEEPEEPPAPPEDEIFEEEESQIEPENREEW